MEIREKYISFAKQKLRALSKRETEISQRLDHLDNLICNSYNLLNINTTLNEYEALKTELHSIYDRKGKVAMCWLVTKGSKRKQEEARGNGTLDCRLYFLNQQRSAKSSAP